MKWPSLCKFSKIATKQKQKYQKKKPIYTHFTEHPEAGAAENFRRFPVLWENVAPNGHTPVNFVNSQKNNQKKSEFAKNYGTPKMASSKPKRKLDTGKHETLFFWAFFPSHNPTVQEIGIQAPVRKTGCWSLIGHAMPKNSHKAKKPQKKPVNFGKRPFLGENDVNTRNHYFCSAKMAVVRIMALGWSDYWRDSGVNVVRLLAPEHIYICCRVNKWSTFSFVVFCVF